MSIKPASLPGIGWECGVSPRFSGSPFDLKGKTSALWEEVHCDNDADLDTDVCTNCWAPFAGPPPELAMEFGGKRQMEENERRKLLSLYEDTPTKGTKQLKVSRAQIDAALTTDNASLEEVCTDCWAPFAGPPPETAMEFCGHKRMAEEDREKVLSLYRDSSPSSASRLGKRSRRSTELTTSVSDSSESSDNEPDAKRRRRGAQEEDDEEEADGPIGVYDSRALPSSAVAMLQEWMLSPEHFDFPWPTKQERRELAAKAGITTKRLTIWFTNARKRVWAPLRRQRGLPVPTYSEAKEAHRTCATMPPHSDQTSIAAEKRSVRASLAAIEDALLHQRSWIEREMRKIDLREEQLARAQQSALQQQSRFAPPLSGVPSPWQLHSQPQHLHVQHCGHFAVDPDRFSLTPRSGGSPMYPSGIATSSAMASLGEECDSLFGDDGSLFAL